MEECLHKCFALCVRLSEQTKKGFKKESGYDIISSSKKQKEEIKMKHIKTLNTQTLNNTMKKGGCGECQTSCQSACKTSCTVGNQTCEQKK